MLYSVGCIAGPQLFLSKEKPLYRTAMNTIIGMCESSFCAHTSSSASARLVKVADLLFSAATPDAVYFVAMLAYREICRRENNRRDMLAANGCVEAEARPAEKEDNKSDIDDLAFRYIL